MDTQQPSKVWWKSKTIWVNGAVVLLTIALYVLNEASHGDVDLGLTPEMVALVMGIVNIILRFVTTQRVSR